MPDPAVSVARSSPEHIIKDTHDRFWHLPEAIHNRKRQARNAYMRAYMPVYRQRRRRVTLTLYPERHDRFAAHAKTHGRPLATFLAEAAEAYLKQTPLLPSDTAERLAQATLEIRRIGTNINQIARHTNQKNHAAIGDIRRCLALLQRLEAGLLPGPAPHGPSHPQPT